MAIHISMVYSPSIDGIFMAFLWRNVHVAPPHHVLARFEGCLSSAPWCFEIPTGSFCSKKIWEKSRKMMDFWRVFWCLPWQNLDFSWFLDVNHSNLRWCFNVFFSMRFDVLSEKKIDAQRSEMIQHHLELQAVNWKLAVSIPKSRPGVGPCRSGSK